MNWVRTGYCFLLCLLGWSFAQDALTFKEAVELAEQAPRLALARSQLELAQKQLTVSGSWLQANVGGGYSRSWTTTELAGVTETDAAGDIDPLGLSATLNLVPYGPRADEVQRREWALTAAALSLRDERHSLMIDLTGQFQTALRAEEEVNVKGLELELASLHLEAATTRLEAGSATSAQVLQSELNLQQAEIDLLVAERAAAQALEALATTLGRAVAAVAGSLPPGSLAEPELTRLSERSDVVNARLDVLAAELLASATLRDNLPSGTFDAAYSTGNEDSRLQLGAQYSMSGPNAYQPSLSFSIDPDTGLPGGTSQRFTLGVSVSIPLDVALPDALRAARLNVAGAEGRAEQILALAQLELRGRQTEIAGAEAVLDLAEQILAQRQASLAVSRQRFDLGLVSQLEVREADVNVAAARLALQRAEDDLRLAHMRLAAALALNPLEVLE